MKRVKLMLTGIALVTVIGGAFAFKAQKFSTKVIYTQRNAQGFCTVSISSSTTTTVDPGTAKVFAHTTNNQACPLNWTKPVDND